MRGTRRKMVEKRDGVKKVKLETLEDVHTHTQVF